MTRRGLGWALLPAVGLPVPAVRRAAGMFLQDCASDEDKAVSGLFP